jgi:hypothetical protein
MNRPKLLLLGAAALALGATAACAGSDSRWIKAPGGVPFDDIELSEHPAMNQSNRLRVSPRGQVHYAIQRWAGSYQRAEVGEYETTVGQAEIAELRRELDTSELESVPDPVLLIDEATRTIAFHQGPRTHHRTARTSELAPAPFLRIDCLLRRIGEQALMHPRQALRMRVVEFVIDESRRAHVTVEVASIGAQPFDPPASGARTAGFSMSLYPDTHLVPEHFWLGNRVQVVTEADAPPGKTASPVVELPLRGSKRYRFEMDLAKANAGPADATISCNSDLGTMELRLPILVPKQGERLPANQAPQGG